MIDSAGQGNHGSIRAGQSWFLQSVVHGAANGFGGRDAIKYGEHR